MRTLCLAWFAIYVAAVLASGLSNHPSAILPLLAIYLFGALAGPELLGHRWPYWSRFRRVPRDG